MNKLVIIGLILVSLVLVIGANGCVQTSSQTPSQTSSQISQGTRSINKYYEWKYETFWTAYTYTYNLNIPMESYDYYKSRSRAKAIDPRYVTYNEPAIQDIAKNLKKIIEEKNYDTIDFTLSFIKNMHYVQDANTGYDEYPKYPIETLVEETGDCEDTSYLTASILRAMGIGVVLVTLPGHMAVGVWCNDCQGTYYEVEGKKYFYLETTGKGWKLGYIPEQYSGTKVSITNVP